ncbi:MAG: CopG family antitoxin [Chloroflexota bacterium]
MENEGKSTISNAQSYEEMAEFWDTHSTADFENQSYEVDITFEPASLRNSVTIELELLKELRKIARDRQISTETLVNVWLRQFVDQTNLAVS